MSLYLANFDTERKAFLALLDAQCAERILLYCGESGSGKTTLLAYCQRHIQPPIAHLPIQLRGATVSVAEIFYRFGDRLGWQHMCNFTQVVNHLTSPTVKVDRNWLIGVNNRISVALQAENPTDREERRTILTSAWFEDLQALDHHVLVVFDTYEAATTDVKDWISGPFLARAAGVVQIRVVVAGQEVPASNNIEWGSCCRDLHLYGVIDAIHWMPIVTAMGKRIPIDPPEVWLAGICHALKGKPDAIIKVIEALPPIETHS